MANKRPIHGNNQTFRRLARGGGRVRRGGATAAGAPGVCGIGCSIPCCAKNEERAATTDSTGIAKGLVFEPSGPEGRDRVCPSYKGSYTGRERRPFTPAILLWQFLGKLQLGGSRSTRTHSWRRDARRASPQTPPKPWTGTVRRNLRSKEHATPAESPSVAKKDTSASPCYAVLSIQLETAKKWDNGESFIRPQRCPNRKLAP